MFNQYQFIPEEHKVALQGVVQSHNITPNKLAALYESALAVLTVEPSKLQLAATLAFSKLVTETHEISVVTNRETGVYVQLAREKGKVKNYFTAGQKWAMEQPSPHSTVNTVFW